MLVNGGSPRCSTLALLALLAATLLLLNGCIVPAPRRTTPTRSPGAAVAAAPGTQVASATPVAGTAGAGTGTPGVTTAASPATGKPSTATSGTASASTPTAIPKPQTRPAGDIVFVREQDLWVVAADGANLRRLTTDGGYSTPRWSPDGARLAFVQGEGLLARVGVMNADGSAKRLVAGTAGSGYNSPVWSPRGTALAFTRTADTNGDGRLDLRDEAEVWVADADAGNALRLANGRDPAWAPEGLRLAYVTNGILTSSPPYRIDNAINVISNRGQNEWTLLPLAKLPPQLLAAGGPAVTPGRALVRFPAWRSDGERFAFVVAGPPNLVLSMNAKGGDVRVVDSSGQASFGRAVWSPAWTALAYEIVQPSGVYETGLADGQGRKVATIGGSGKGLQAADVAWAPDGAAVIFAQMAAEPYLGTASPSGSGPQSILGGPVRWPDWAGRR